MRAPPHAAAVSEDDDLKALLEGATLEEGREGGGFLYAASAGSGVLDLGALAGSWAHDAEPPLLWSPAEDVAALCGLLHPCLPGAFGDADELLPGEPRGVDVLIIVDISPGARLRDFNHALSDIVGVLKAQDRICLIDTDTPRRRSRLMRADDAGKANVTKLASRVRGVVLGAGSPTTRLAGALEIAAGVLDHRALCNADAVVLVLSFGPGTTVASQSIDDGPHVEDTAPGLLAAAQRCCRNPAATAIAHVAAPPRARVCCYMMGFGCAHMVVDMESGAAEPPAVRQRRAIAAACGGSAANWGHASQLRHSGFLEQLRRPTGPQFQSQPVVPLDDDAATAAWASLCAVFPAANIIPVGPSPADDHACLAAIAAHEAEERRLAAAEEAVARPAAPRWQSRRLAARDASGHATVTQPFRVARGPPR